MKLCNIGHNFDYETEKLIRIFLPFEKIEITHELSEGERLAVCTYNEKTHEVRAQLFLNGKKAEFVDTVTEYPNEELEKTCERRLAVCLYDCFAELTGYKAPFGILTGIRPAKLFSRFEKQLTTKGAENFFENEFRVSKNKISLCRQTVKCEDKIVSLSKENSFSLYLSIPFCPSRCSYCSFVSHSVENAGKIIPRYVEKLCEELKLVAKIAEDTGLRLETVYVGGGTPTAIDADRLDTVLKTVNGSFNLDNLREFTVEAGRPDTITAEKLEVIKRNGATRISINPQTMNDEVLKNIGRRHTAEQMRDAFKLARKMGFDNINTDLIAGLPLDTVESFNNTLSEILALDPESVTVHSLSMKRASTLTKNGELPEISAGIIADKMVENARKVLTEHGVLPYYMYRQSKTVGNLENVGYAKKGYEGLYNVYIMDETHTILACGASAVTKLRNPRGGEIERIFNFKYPYEYISRFDEQTLRKEKIAQFYEKYGK